MTLFFITLGVLVLSLLCITVMVLKFIQSPPESLSIMQYIKLIISGVIAFIADTLGIGSFAINIALAKILTTFTDDEMPAVCNGAQVIPGMIESLFFLNLIDVDLTTLLSLTAGTCIGGLLGGSIVSHLSKQAIRLAMFFCFGLIIFLVISNQFHLLPIGGKLVELHSWKLFLGFFAMMVCGALTSVGIGLFAMVQGVLFLMNISPVVAFPIMTTAGAMQQPLTTLVFLKHNKIPLKKTIILSLAGCIGVFITIPVFMKLTFSWLHTLLLFILIYNFFSVGRTYLRVKKSNKHKVQFPTSIPLPLAE